MPAAPPLLPYNTFPYTLRPPVPDHKKPNYAIANALATFEPTLAFKVLNCWHEPFFRPCRQPRLCQGCARYQQRDKAKKNERALSEMVTPYFLTLTIPCTEGLTRWHLKRFRKKLTSLRRWRRFQRSVRGGIYSIEIKFGDSGLWNIHAHIVLDLADHTLATPAMREAWRRRTGGTRVEFEPIKSGTLAWVFSYSTKPQEAPLAKSTGEAVKAMTEHLPPPLDPTRLREFYWATKGFRNTQTFGSFNAGSGIMPGLRRARQHGGSQ